MSTTHWYARYIGDYQRKTSHLSMVEHGAYTMLLDWCYANESPIPLDSMQVHRICRAFAEDERNAVDFVLVNFFEKTQDGWVNRRVAQEIENKKEVSEKRRHAAKNRWCKSNANGNAIAYANGNAKPMLSTTTTTTTSITRKTSNKLDVRDDVVLPDWLPKESWEEFKQHRRNKKDPLSHLAETKALKLLSGLVSDGEDPVALIDKAIASGWKTFYVTNKPSKTFNKPTKTLEERFL